MSVAVVTSSDFSLRAFIPTSLDVCLGRETKEISAFLAVVVFCLSFIFSGWLNTDDDDERASHIPIR